MVRLLALTRSARTEREPQTHDAHEAIIKKGSGIRYTARRIKKGQHCLGCRSAWAKASRVQRHGRARGRGLANGIMVSIYSALVWSHQSTSLIASASCVPRVDIIHALGRASRVPQNVEGLTRPPRSAPAPPIPFTLAKFCNAQGARLTTQEARDCYCYCYNRPRTVTRRQAIPPHDE